MSPLRFALSRSLLLLLLASACAVRTPSDRPARTDRNLLTQAQLIEHNFATAWEAVEALRPNWLQSRTNSLQSTSIVLVYQDDTRLGGVEHLRQIATQTLMYIRYYDPVEATARWGLDHAQGVILVSTRN